MDLDCASLSDRASDGPSWIHLDLDDVTLLPRFSLPGALKQLAGDFSRCYTTACLSLQFFFVDFHRGTVSDPMVK
jgi:hypothetical protein